MRAATVAPAPDLKPQNIMLVPDSHVNLGERAKLLDFGLAKVSEKAGGVTVQTRANMLIGTDQQKSLPRRQVLS